MSLRKRPSSAAGRGKPRQSPPPRNVEVEITEIGARGDGIAQLGGDLVFVPFTVPGDRVVARIEGRRGDGLAAALIEVTREGPGRSLPPARIMAVAAAVRCNTWMTTSTPSGKAACC